MIALGYSMSVAMWVGIIALFGIDAETGVFMLLYLDLAYEKARQEHHWFAKEHLYEAIVEGRSDRRRRLRKKLPSRLQEIFGSATNTRHILSSPGLFQHESLPPSLVDITLGRLRFLCIGVSFEDHGQEAQVIKFIVETLGAI